MLEETLAVVWQLDRSFVIAFCASAVSTRPNVYFERQCLVHPFYPTHQRLDSASRASRNLSESCFGFSAWWRFLYRRCYRRTCSSSRGKRLIARSATFRLRSVSFIVLGLWFCHAVWEKRLQGGLFPSELSFPDGSAPQFRSRPCHLSPSSGLRLDNGCLLRPTGRALIAGRLCVPSGADQHRNSKR